VFDGPVDGVSFRAYVEQFVVPILRPDDIVIKVAGIKEAIEAAGAKLRYLPAYSPDLNPIEQLFAKLKALLRKTLDDQVRDPPSKRRADAVICTAFNPMPLLRRRYSPRQGVQVFASKSFGHVYLPLVSTAARTKARKLRK
jgi:DDE superfamily endonuclease